MNDGGCCYRSLSEALESSAAVKKELGFDSVPGDNDINKFKTDCELPAVGADMSGAFTNACAAPTVENGGITASTMAYNNADGTPENGGAPSDDSDGASHPAVGAAATLAALFAMAVALLL